MQTLDKLKKIIISWKETGDKKLINRHIHYTLDNNRILTVVGPRRSGKTSLLHLMIQKLKIKVPENNIVYINFEDERLYPLNGDELTLLVSAYQEIADIDPDHRLYLFLDEIQNIPYWEKWARRINEQEEIKLILTGSSSKLLSKEISTSLRGRCDSISVFPLSFVEYLSAKKITYDKKTLAHSTTLSLVRKHLSQYMSYGGFPEVVTTEDIDKKQEILQNYFSAMFHRDIVDRYSVKNVHLLHNYLGLLMAQCSLYMSYGKAENTLKSFGFKVSKSTLMDYMHYAEEIFLLFQIPILSYKVKDQLQYPRKIYSIDTGLTNAISFKASENLGRQMENLVFCELLRREKEVYYWKNKQGKEVDFVIRKQLRVVELIQVCRDISDETTKKREIHGLLLAMEEFNLNEALIITGDFSGSEQINGKKITYIPLWAWLLGV